MAGTRYVARLAAVWVLCSWCAGCANDAAPEDGAGASQAPVFSETGGTGGTSGAGGAGGTAATGGAAGTAGASPTDAGGSLDAGHTPPLPSSGCSAASSPASGEHTLDVDGTERTYIVSVPDGYDPNTPYRLVFVWHGFTITASQVAASGFGGLEAQANGSAIFVAGQGLNTTLAGVTAPGWDNMNGRDMAFASAMLDWLRGSYCIDDARIFTVGTSYGGYFSNQVACELNAEFRAVASLMGGGPLQLGGVRCTQPMAAWLTHGTMDMVNAYAQGESSRDHWVSVNHCATTSTAIGSDGCVTYDDCDAGFPVQWCSHEGGHTIPAFAAASLWTFLSQF